MTCTKLWIGREACFGLEEKEDDDSRMVESFEEKPSDLCHNAPAGATQIGVYTVSIDTDRSDKRADRRRTVFCPVLILSR